MTRNEVLGHAQLSAHAAYLILEEPLQRFTQLQVHLLGQTTHVMVALDDLAISKGVEFDELLDDIESIVYSGTKLNIDYFLEEILDEENMNEIYDYFKSSDTDNIDIAVEELGGEYSEEEIRLVRVKFISEMGN